MQRICDRYNPANGRITLTSDKYTDREANRRDIMTLLYSLIQEAHHRYPTGDRYSKYSRL